MGGFQIYQFRTSVTTVVVNIISLECIAIMAGRYTEPNDILAGTRLYFRIDTNLTRSIPLLRGPATDLLYTM